MAFTPAGHTQQSSLGYFVTRDATSVRHEQPRSEQTKEMIEQAYDPLQKRPPRSTSAWQAMLLANTTDFRKDIENIEQEVNKLLDNSAAKSKSRSAGSMLRRAAARLTNAWVGRRHLPTPRATITRTLGPRPRRTRLPPGRCSIAREA